MSKNLLVISDKHLYYCTTVPGRSHEKYVCTMCKIRDVFFSIYLLCLFILFYLIKSKMEVACDQKIKMNESLLL